MSTTGDFITAVRELLDAHEAEAKAVMTAENARDNFTDCQPEADAAARAMVRASAATKRVRELLDSITWHSD